MHTTGPGAAGRHHTRAQIEAAIVRAETELTLRLERLEQRRAAGRECTVAENLVQAMQTRLATLHLERGAALKDEE
jgi:hypothetical protein